MQISLRSHLIAGTAAVVGASAIAMTPVAAHVNVPSVKLPSGAQVALTTFANPLTELIATLGLVNEDLFDGANIYDAYSWEPYVGIVPEFIFTALPVISQLGYNGSAYIGNTIGALGFAARTLSDAVWNLGPAVITAAQQAIGGDVAAAITTLTNATLVPIQDALTTVIGAGTSVITGVVTNITNLIAAVPSIAQGLVNTVVGSVTALVQTAVAVVTDTFSSLVSLDFQGAWNSVVVGTLGQAGLLGTLESVTIGPGVGYDEESNTFAVPSLRMWAEQSQLTVADALGGSYLAPTAASVSAPSAAAAKAVAARVAAPAAAVATPASENAADDAAAVADTTPAVTRPVAGVDAGASAGTAATVATENAGAAAENSSADAPKPVKKGVSRKAAKAAAAN